MLNLSDVDLVAWNELPLGEMKFADDVTAAQIASRSAFLCLFLSGVSRERRQKVRKQCNRTSRPGQPASASAGYEVRSPA